MPKLNKITEKKIEKIFNEYMQGKLSGEKVAIEHLMNKYGYAKTTSSTCQVTQTTKWQQLLEEINDEPFMQELQKIALGDGKDSDKIKAITEVLKLKKRYPEQQKSPKNVFQTQINNLLADDEEVIEIHEDKQVSED
jgi:hypothetical protein